MERPFYPSTRSGDGSVEKRAQAVNRLPGGAHGEEDGLRPPQGGGAPLDRLTEVSLEVERSTADVPSPMSAECFGGVLSGASPAARYRRTPWTFSTASRDELEERWTRASAPSRTSASGSCGAASGRSGIRRSRPSCSRSTERSPCARCCRTGAARPSWLLDPDDPLATSPTGPRSRPATANTRPRSTGGNLVAQARQYKADGAIFNNNWAASRLRPRHDRQGRAVAPCAVPSLTINCDVIDAPSPAGRRSRASWTASSR